MPTYDYECQACGHAFELFQGITDKLRRKCPACGKTSLQRLIGPGAGFLFKGQGFYSTDYRSESYRSGEKSDKVGTDKGSASADKAAADKGSANADKGASDRGSATAPDKTGGAAKGNGKSSTDSGSGKSAGTKPKRGKSANRG